MLNNRGTAPPYYHGERDFPNNVFQPKYYGVFRVLSLIFLLVCIAGYLYTLTAVPTALVPEKSEYVEQRGLIKEAWYGLVHTLWQGASKETQAEEYAKQEVASGRFWAGIWVVIAGLLVWLSFDTEKANHALAAAMSMFGSIFYLLLPNDAVPDILPVGGVTDDAVVVLMGSAIAVSSILGYLRTNDRQKQAPKAPDSRFQDEYDEEEMYF